MMRHFRVIKDVAMIGGISAMVVFALQGCDNQSQKQELNQSVKKGAFVLLEEQNDGSYKILEEYPSGTTHVVVRDKNGIERVLSQAEIDQLLKEEERKINNNTSELTSSGSQGLGLGGAILASAAGAILGSYIGNKLFNNPNYQQNQQRNYKSPQAYERSQNSFKNTSSTPNTAAKSGAKSGFFKNSSATSQSIGG
ncbi:UPF0323 family lipoprotein [Helicobacter anatolicus]|uniref:UPF0323 family lipoprotein n=1 Tax=Helicobacter anatolicus TaxID=2905874 RepID=UPI001E418498|nr:UPF0323 family lipoprotein [Helicobacter anatolicus]MCE3036334.1 UPF0323 family lipoprotein [Helicobacter anatolicus]MCE3039252.1 UPF0323 family lipoprotein [Helicobacter anatolicus]